MFFTSLYRNALGALGAFALLVAAPALASSDAPPADAHAADAGHATDAAPAEDHGDAHHVSYSGDDDGDGTANWLDSDSEGYMLKSLGTHSFNLLLLFGVLYYVARRPIGDAIKNRALGIRKELTDTARERDEAKAKFEELEARLARFEDEVVQMKATAAEHAAAEQAHLEDRAREAAVRIGDNAQRSIQDELLRAKQAIRAEAVELAVQLAEQTLRSRVQADDQKRLAKQFLDSIGDEVTHG